MFTSSEPRHGIVLFEMKDAQSEADGAAYITALHALSVRTQPVLLIMTVQGHTDQDHETRKQAALWFKQNRDRLSAFLYGVIRVDDHDHDHEGHAEELESSNFAKMLPFPIKHADSLEKAYAMAENWPKR
ncbi:hypothetical protein [Thalassospira xiamenensis]|uniref:hypothetical protein n=1 Tax=Thalassospira xiamenensis TaxID=220697 RepID=UPI003AA7B69F